MQILTCNDAVLRVGMKKTRQNVSPTVEAATLDNQPASGAGDLGVIVSSIDGLGRKSSSLQKCSSTATSTTVTSSSSSSSSRSSSSSSSSSSSGRGSASVEEMESNVDPVAVEPIDAAPKSATAAAHPTRPPPSELSGTLLKRSRRHGDRRPWQRRYFVLRSGTLLYSGPSNQAAATAAAAAVGKSQGESSAPVLRVFVHLTAGTRICCTAAPKGYGLEILAPRRADAITAVAAAAMPAASASSSTSVTKVQISSPASSAAVAVDLPSPPHVCKGGGDTWRSFAVAAPTEAEQGKWLQALQAAVGCMPVNPRDLVTDYGNNYGLASPQSPERGGGGEGGGGGGGGGPGRVLRTTQAVAGTLASSRFGRAVVRRYLSEPGRNLVDAVLAYALRRDGKREAGLLENALWDVFARVAVVVRAKALPPGVDRQTLSEATIDFCQCFLRHARDRRLEAQRRRVRHGADPEPVDLVELRLQAGVIVKTWRELVEPQCSTGTLERYRHLTTYFFGEAQLLDVFENREYRQLLSVMESNIIELLEHY